MFFFNRTEFEINYSSNVTSPRHDDMRSDTLQRQHTKDVSYVFYIIDVFFTN
jgi:hypothetical protein